MAMTQRTVSRSTRALRAMAAGLLVLAACASPARQLAESRNFDQAMCAAAFHSREPSHELEHVRRRLDAAARPRLHLQAIPPEALEAALGPPGRALAQEMVVVRVVTGIDTIDVTDVQVRAVLVAGGRAIAPTPLSPEVIAVHTQESIPPTVVESHGGNRQVSATRFAQRPLMGLTAAVLEASTLFIVPVTEMTGHTTRVPVTTTRTAPTDAEIAAAAPSTAALMATAKAFTYRDDATSETSAVWLWPRVAGDDVRIVVDWRYKVAGCVESKPRMRRVPTHSVDVGDTTEVRLPRGPGLEARINARFGDRMMLLGRPPGVPAGP